MRSSDGSFLLCSSALTLRQSSRPRNPSRTLQWLLPLLLSPSSSRYHTTMASTLIQRPLMFMTSRKKHGGRCDLTSLPSSFLHLQRVHQFRDFSSMSHALRPNRQSGKNLLLHSCSSAQRKTKTRRFSHVSIEHQTKQNVHLEKNEKLLDPYEILRDLSYDKKSNDIKQNGDSSNVKIPLPTHFSPTSLSTFQSCPQAFFFLYILKLKPDPPITPELARGILCHRALEEVFDLRPEERSLGNLENLLRRGWQEKRGDRSQHNGIHGSADGSNKNRDTSDDEGYNTLFRYSSSSKDDSTFSLNKFNILPDDMVGNIESAQWHYDIDAEIEWGQQCLWLLKNYYDLEDPKAVPFPNPLMREMWVQAQFPLNNDDSTVPDGFGNQSNMGDVESKSFIVRGKIDRIDLLPHLPQTDHQPKVQLQIIDYKTGKAPHFKYSPATNDRIAHEQFWNMKLYALILWKMVLQTEENAGATSQKDNQKQRYFYGLPWMLQQKLLQVFDDLDSHLNITNRSAESTPKWSSILQLHSLRLMYLTSHIDDISANNIAVKSRSMNGHGNTMIGKAKYLDHPLGSTPHEFEQTLKQTEEEIISLGKEIQTLVDMQDPKVFVHCDRKFCSCHDIRKKFRHGTVWCRETDGYGSP